MEDKGTRSEGFIKKVFPVVVAGGNILWSRPGRKQTDVFQQMEVLLARVLFFEAKVTWVFDSAKFVNRWYRL